MKLSQDIEKAVDQLNAALFSLTVDNFKGALLTGTTSGTPDTQAFFTHGLKGTPRCHWLVEGNVYVPVGGHGPKQIDIRSPLASQPFKILVIL